MNEVCLKLVPRILIQACCSPTSYLLVRVSTYRQNVKRMVRWVTIFQYYKSIPCIVNVPYAGSADVTLLHAGALKCLLPSLYGFFDLGRGRSSIYKLCISQSYTPTDTHSLKDEALLRLGPLSPPGTSILRTCLSYPGPSFHAQSSHCPCMTSGPLTDGIICTPSLPCSPRYWKSTGLGAGFLGNSSCPPTSHLGDLE